MINNKIKVCSNCMTPRALQEYGTDKRTLDNKKSICNLCIKLKSNKNHE